MFVLSCSLCSPEGIALSYAFLSPIPNSHHTPPLSPVARTILGTKSEVSKHFSCFKELSLTKFTYNSSFTLCSHNIFTNYYHLSFYQKKKKELSLYHKSLRKNRINDLPTMVSLVKNREFNSGQLWN